MIIKFPDNKYLTDSSGDRLMIEGIRNVYAALITENYKVMNLLYGRDCFMKTDILKRDFEVVENSGSIHYSKNKVFEYEYDCWYNSELDMYVMAGREDSDGLSLMDDDDEDTIDKGYHKITYVFHKDNIEDVSHYLNENTVGELSTDSKIDIIIQTQSGYRFNEHSINPLPVDIETMYNDDFVPVYEHIVDKLNNNGKGIVLLHGVAGSGKSNLIKHLTTVVKHKFVFLPIGMIGHLSSPSFIGDLLSKKGCVLVIEDCENYIQDRELSRDSIVSSLLQITDGILSDITDIKVICTFNTDLTKIDSALLREGRLIAEYKFEKLDRDKVELLTGKPTDKDCTLSEIYNTLTYTENKVEETKIGFGR